MHKHPLIMQTSTKTGHPKVNIVFSSKLEDFLSL